MKRDSSQDSVRSLHTLKEIIYKRREIQTLRISSMSSVKEGGLGPGGLRLTLSLGMLKEITTHNKTVFRFIELKHIKENKSVVVPCPHCPLLRR